jgi:alpha-L-fucosidase
MKTNWHRKPWFYTGSATVNQRFIALVTSLIILAALSPQVNADNPGLAKPIESPEQHEARIAWWREARFGMFIHWGLYSIPAGVWKDKVHETGYSEWIMLGEKIPVKEYELLARRFNPTKFDAKAWVAIAKQAGMKYMVLTTKHHEGFSMFKSRLTPYNIVDATPFKRDVTRELAAACRDAGLRFGCYYSIDRDWYRANGRNNYQQNNSWDFPDTKREDFDRYFATFAMPQVAELLENYRPDLLWFDEIEMKTEGQVDELYQMVRRLGPKCLLNSRIKDCRFPSKIPPPYCDYISTGDNEIAEKPLGFEWEDPGTLNTSYGYNQGDTNWVDAREVVARLVEIVSKGGNYLLNVGPTAEGVIPQPSVDRLMEVGAWLKVNGEAIHGSLPWKVFHEQATFWDNNVKISDTDALTKVDVRFTAKGNSVYAICMAWPEKYLLVKALSEQAVPGKTVDLVRVLGTSEAVTWFQTSRGLVLSVPREKPCRHAFVYRIDFKEGKRSISNDK